METIKTIHEYDSLIGKGETFLLFVKTENCSVCEGLKPQIEAFEANYLLPFYEANGSKIPELTGKLLLFTAPVVLIFHKGKEIHRFARFIHLEELRNKLDILEEEPNV